MIFKEEDKTNEEKHGVTTNPSFAFTPKGCEIAREFLKSKGVPIPSGWTGWEIVHEANKLMGVK